MEQKGKSWLDLSLQYGARSRNVGLSILFISEFEERGVRKVTTVPYEGVGGQTCRMVEYGPTVAQCRSTMPIV